VSSLGPPPAPERLRNFPSYDLPGTLALARIHANGRDPWYFSSRMSGRFDLPEPYGACYLAETATGAFVEVFQRWIAQRIPIPRTEVAVRQASALFAPGPFRLADCTAPGALAFGATGLIHTSPDRALTQTWAAAFHAAGFGGVRYLVSTAPSMQLVGIALFGPSGEAAWPVVATDPIRDAFLDEIGRVFGVLVR
jgi:hypothetical protein